MMRARLAYAFHCSPADLRDITMSEAHAMAEVLSEVEQRYQEGLRRGR